MFVRLNISHLHGGPGFGHGQQPAAGLAAGSKVSNKSNRSVDAVSGPRREGHCVGDCDTESDEGLLHLNLK